MPPEAARAGGALFLARVGHRMESYQAGLVRSRIYAAAVEYRYHSLFRAIMADANQYVSGEDITANCDEIADSLKDYVAFFKIIIGNISSVIR